jgi:chemotaxis protein CheZ
MSYMNPETLAAERRALLHYVTIVRRALTDLRPVEMRSEHLPTAITEIAMIVETTESAANQIMQATEEILEQQPDAAPDAYRAFVDERCLQIMAACAFQDLTGQRISKVVETLLKLESKIGGLAELLGEGVEEQAPEPVRVGVEILLNGPAAPGEGVDQDDIDRLFA